ncbi:MAG: tetratricopeptide repeat protein, partial [Gammaproteobacteria bacterium]
NHTAFAIHPFIQSVLKTIAETSEFGKALGYNSSDIIKKALPQLMKKLNFFFGEDKLNFERTSYDNNYYKLESATESFINNLNIKELLSLTDSATIIELYWLILRGSYLLYAESYYYRANALINKITDIQKWIENSPIAAQWKLTFEQECYFNLLQGKIFYRLNNDTKAKEHFDKVITSLKDSWFLFNKKKLFLAIAYSCIGDLQSSRYEKESAKASLQEAIKYKEELFYKPNSELGLTYLIYANYLCAHEEGNYTQALEFYQKAKNIFKNFYSSFGLDAEKHPYMGLAFYHEAFLYYKQGNYINAKKSIEDALGVFSANNPDNRKHLRIVQSEILLAKILLNLSHLQDAKAKLKKILPFCSETNNTKENYTSHRSDAKYALGRILFKQALYDEAEDNYRAALNDLKKFNNNEKYNDDPKIAQLLKLEKYQPIYHADSAKIIHYYGLIYYKLGRYEDAKCLFIEALRINTRLCGNETTDISVATKLYSEHKKAKAALTILELANLNFRQGNYLLAETQYKEVLAIQISVYGEKSDNEELQITKSCLMRLYIHEMRYDEALKYVIKRTAERDGDDAESLSFILINAKMLFCLGDYQRALTWIENVYKYQPLNESIDANPTLHPYVIRLHCLRAQIYFYQGQYHQSLAVLNALTEQASYQQLDKLSINRLYMEVYLALYDIDNATKIYATIDSAIGLGNQSFPEVMKVILSDARFSYTEAEKDNIVLNRYHEARYKYEQCLQKWQNLQEKNNITKDLIETIEIKLTLSYIYYRISELSKEKRTYLQKSQAFYEKILKLITTTEFNSFKDQTSSPHIKAFIFLLSKIPSFYLKNLSEKKSLHEIVAEYLCISQDFPDKP